MKKRDYFNLSLIISIVFFIILITKRFNLYGSEVDWLSQHSVLPEYFRNLFYETKNLFPNFAPHIGAGQNIYNFSYYGFLNPLILISYFLPFVKMVDYIMISSIIIVLVSIVLLYKWLRDNNYKNVFLGTFIFALSNPLIFHSHRHLMFINYMPFLILGLMGIDKYFEKGNFYLLPLSVFLIIMTSYFYSVGALIVLGLYSIYKIILNNYNKNHLLKLLFLVLIGILMSFILLLPTFYVITKSRGTIIYSVNFVKLFKPNFLGVMYSNYALGLNSFSFICLITSIFNKNKEVRFLALVLSVLFFIPVFAYLLNGMLYIRYKVFISFLPLCILLIANYNFEIKKEVLIFLVFVLLYSLKYNVFNLFIVDLILTFIVIYFVNKKKSLSLFLLIIPFFNCLTGNLEERFVTKKRYFREFNEENEKLISSVINNDNSMYRFTNLDSALSTSNKVYNMSHFQTTLYSSTYNFLYNDFYYNVFRNAIPYRNRVITASSPNILFQTFMGVKYIATKNSPPLNYKLVKSHDDFNIYINDSVYPLVYASSKITNYDDFSKLEYPYSLEPILNGVVAYNNETNYIIDSLINEVDLNYKVINKEVDIKKNKLGYEINAVKTSNLKLEIDPSKLIIITFKMNYNSSCADGDLKITINDITNNLSCRSHIYHNKNFDFTYVISANDLVDFLNITFSKGKYVISDIKTYTMDFKKNNFKALNVDSFKSYNGKLCGKIDVDKDGYLISTIPYDDGFTIKLNGVEVLKEKVNLAFLGTKIKKGRYEVEISYKAPLFKEGMIGSIIGFVCFIFVGRILNEDRNSN